MSEYIEREALRDALYEADAITMKGIAIINQFTTADVVPVVRGEWVDKGSLSCRCSECGCKSNKEYTYCPNCGAKMESEGST